MVDHEFKNKQGVVVGRTDKGTCWEDEAPEEGSNYDVGEKCELK